MVGRKGLELVTIGYMAKRNLGCRWKYSYNQLTFNREIILDYSGGFSAITGILNLEEEGICRETGKWLCG